MKSLQAIALTGILVLTACGAPTASPPDDEPAESADASGAPTGEDYGNWEGEEITVAILGGLMPVVFGQEAEKFEELTGLKVNLVDVPFGELYNRFQVEARSGTGAFDLMTVGQYMVGDFIPFLEPFDNHADGDVLVDPDGLVPAYLDLSKVGDQTYCLPIDGDVWILYYRKSMFSDADNQEAFEAEYGYELAPPATWDQWADVGEFFTRDGNYGSALMAARVFMGLEFQQRFYSFGGQWFDPETMDAQVNNEAGVQALESIIETVKNSPPGVLNYGFAETNDDFVQGRLPMIIQWGDTGGQSGDPERAAPEVLGDVGYAPVPGAELNGELHQPQLLAWGFCLQMSKDSDNKDAASQFARYFTSPEVSDRVVAQSQGLDPYRTQHFEGRKDDFEGADEWMQQTLESAEAGVPDLLIPGATRYFDIIAERLGQVLAENQSDPDQIDVQATLDDIATRLDALTDELGRDSQKAAYESQMLSNPHYSELSGE